MKVTMHNIQNSFSHKTKYIIQNIHLTSLSLLRTAVVDVGVGAKNGDITTPSVLLERVILPLPPTVSCFTCVKNILS